MEILVLTGVLSKLPTTRGRVRLCSQSEAESAGKGKDGDSQNLTTNIKDKVVAGDEGKENKKQP